MRTKTFTLIVLVMIALGTLGYSFACSNGGVQVTCECNCSVVFTKVVAWDNQKEKHVGNVSAAITCSGDTINVCIMNAYPCYRVFVNYTIKNEGQYPVHFVSTTIVNPNPVALEITTTNHTCMWLQPCQTTRGQTTVHILQAAKQNWQYTFQIKTGITCQTVQPCSMAFWKQQFSSCTCKGDPQVSPATLLQYLNQISTLSGVFKFTGTQAQRFQQALSILSPSDSSSMEAKLKAQLLALWLNYLAGWTTDWTFQGMSAWQIIQGSESALLNHGTSRYEYWKNLCDGFNNLGGG